MELNKTDALRIIVTSDLTDKTDKEQTYIIEHSRREMNNIINMSSQMNNDK